MHTHGNGHMNPAPAPLLPRKLWIHRILGLSIYSQTQCLLNTCQTRDNQRHRWSGEGRPDAQTIVTTVLMKVSSTRSWCGHRVEESALQGIWEVALGKRQWLSRMGP